MKGYLGEIFQQTGTELWCDSPSPSELSHMMDLGAYGATSNPALINKMASENKESLAANIAAARAQGGLPNWTLTKSIIAKASELLLPIYDATEGRSGYICCQVDPRQWNDTAAMIAMAKEADAVAPNVSVKVPVTKAGIAAVEELAFLGITGTATVSYTVPQAVQVAEAFRRGLARAKAAGQKPRKPVKSFTVLMVGRLDDHLRDVVKEQGLDIKPELVACAGNAVGKKTYKIFKERNYESKLLIAATRGNHHIEQYIGGDVVITMTPGSEAAFGEHVGHKVPKCRIDEQVPQETIDELSRTFVDFRRAYAEDGMTLEEFDNFGSVVKTLKQFVKGWEDLIELVGAVEARS